MCECIDINPCEVASLHVHVYVFVMHFRVFKGCVEGGIKATQSKNQLNAVVFAEGAPFEHFNTFQFSSEAYTFLEQLG